MSFEIIRDPLWNNIRVEPWAMALVDTAPMQRLRYVRQLGLAHLVYPGATHTRFEHALGAYHLTRRALELLGENDPIDAGEAADARAALLLHDIGHYPFSHALEEIGAPHHEDLARPLVLNGELAERLDDALGPEAPARIFALIRGRSGSPLQGLVAGSLDLDKIEYLKRDALMCGVPYGEIDVDRLIQSMRIVEDPATGHGTIGLREKGLAALESLLFAKYQMYRNVYWHHAVRSATAMYKRLVSDALATRRIGVSALTRQTDEGLLAALDGGDASPLLTALRARRLYKRAIECPAAQLGETQPYEWIASDHEAARAAEDGLADELGLEPGEVLIDFPAKTQMLSVDLLVASRDGSARRLTDPGWEGAINLPSLADALYRSARWLRVFVARPATITRQALLTRLAR